MLRQFAKENGRKLLPVSPLLHHKTVGRILHLVDAAVGLAAVSFVSFVKKLGKKKHQCPLCLFNLMKSNQAPTAVSFLTSCPKGDPQQARQ